MKRSICRLMLAIVLLAAPGCASLGVADRQPSLPLHIARERALRDATPTTVMFTDGSAAEYPAGALVHRMRATGSGRELLIVRGVDSLAAYDRSKVHALRVGGTIVSPAITPIAGSGDGGSGGSGYCDPSIQDCPVCNTCSGPVPDGQFGDVDCLNGFNCSVDALQTRMERGFFVSCNQRTSPANTTSTRAAVETWPETT